MSKSDWWQAILSSIGIQNVLIGVVLGLALGVWGPPTLHAELSGGLTSSPLRSYVILLIDVVGSIALVTVVRALVTGITSAIRLRSKQAEEGRKAVEEYAHFDDAELGLLRAFIDNGASHFTFRDHHERDDEDFAGALRRLAARGFIDVSRPRYNYDNEPNTVYLRHKYFVFLSARPEMIGSTARKRIVVA